MVPTLVENSKFFCAFVNFFVNKFMTAGELTHTTSEMVLAAPILLIII